MHESAHGQVIWGNPDACASNPLFRYELCCFGSQSSFNGVVLKRSCFPTPLNPERCCVAAPRVFPTSPARRFNLTGDLEHHPALVGCMADSWQLFFTFFRFTRGCLPCYSNEEQFEMYLAGRARFGRFCRMGELLLSFTRVVALAIRRRVAEAWEEAVRLISQESWAWVPNVGESAVQLPGHVFFDLTGHTPKELIYVMDQLISAHAMPLNRSMYSRAATARGSSVQPLEPMVVFDFGVAGGGDLNYYLLNKHLRVLGIDSDSNKLQAIADRLANKWKLSWNLCQASVVIGPEGTELEASSLGGSSGFARGPIRLSADADRLSCVDVARQFPWDADSRNHNSYWKIDLDGYDAACLQSLLHHQGERITRTRPQSIASPRFISVEFAHSYICKETQDECLAENVRQRAAQLNMLELLMALGYRKFKLVRQRFYNLLATAYGIEDGWDEDREGMVQRFGSGLIGEEAVDYFSGTRWREFSDILGELSFLEMEAKSASYEEWYDLHAQLDSR